MSELRSATTHLEANFCPHCGKPNYQNSPMEDGKETLDAILEQVVASANQATEARDEAVLHAQRIEQNMESSIVGPMFDRLRSEMHDMMQRIAALEMAVTGKTIRTGRRNK